MTKAQTGTSASLGPFHAARVRHDNPLLRRLCCAGVSLIVDVLSCSTFTPTHSRMVRPARHTQSACWAARVGAPSSRSQRPSHRQCTP
jgi:hypothetical protein